MSDQNFISDLMQHILEGVKIPKVQVERAVSPILSMFIGSITDALFQNNLEISGENQLVSPEFPLKKENNQSTNIDYLLVNNATRTLILFEVKTDIQSFDQDQLDIYDSKKESVKLQSGKMLRSDLACIRNGSNRPEKYDYIISRFDEMINSAESIHKIIIIYLVPRVLKEKISTYLTIDHVFCFEDLPTHIFHKYAEYWSIIRSKLLLLDEYFKVKKTQNADGDPMKVIVKNINQYLSITKKSLEPDYVQMGIKGLGNTPNYQVTFTNGSIKTFYFSGKEHRANAFKEKNLGQKSIWNNIKNENC